ncbi:MAG: hypothetical protein FWH57_07380 [Oscillospiraceae bacterium]|nr:hypothetical protein [Oscillospiraceae bacterium]
MGFDVSFHPINENEMLEWYFDRLEEVRQNDLTSVRALTQRFNMDDIYAEKYIHVLKTGAQADSDLAAPFDKTHGFYVAVAQGFFRTYFYLRGSMLTDLIDSNPEFSRYTKPWKEILHTDFARWAENKITENYCSGVFLPYEQVRRIYDDYMNVPAVMVKMDAIFPNGHIDVMLRAFGFCLENRLGLLEATEVIEPNPLDLNNSASYSNLYHCDTQGPLLYQQTALAEVAGAMAARNDKHKKPSGKSNKKGFFSRFFEK